MLRDDAVIRITDGLGFRSNLTAKAILRLQEAQRDLEMGKTLPWFLQKVDQALTLSSGNPTVTIPTDFIRFVDDELIRYTPSGATKQFVIPRKRFDEAMFQYGSSATAAGAPQVFARRSLTFFFFPYPDTTYNLTWSYFAKAALLTTNVENLWLQYAPEYIIGEAGLRLARDARDEKAIKIFSDMQAAGKVALFGEEIQVEQDGGPLGMTGEND